MAGDACALFADGFLGNLHKNFLSFLKQIADERNRRILTTAETASPSTAALAVARTTLTIAIMARPGTLCALGITRGCGRRALLRLRKGIEDVHGLLKFDFLTIFFNFSGNGSRGMRVARLRERRMMNLSYSFAGLAV